MNIARSIPDDEAALQAILPLSNSIGCQRISVRFRNTTSHNFADMRAHRVPNIVHFIFGMEEDEVFGLNHYLAVASAKTVQNPAHIYLHHVYLPTGFYWDLLSGLIEVRRILQKDVIFGDSTIHLEHKLNVARLRALVEYGGIYLDFDMAFLQSFDSLLDNDLVMGLDSDTSSTSLSNTLIIAAKDSNILNKWLNLYSTSNTSLWRMNNSLLPEKLLDEYPTEIKVLGHKSILWPQGDSKGTDIIFTNDGGNRSDCLAVHLWGSNRMKSNSDRSMMWLLHNRSPLLSHFDVYLPTPLISVIMPCYNQRQFIRQAINSVLGQSWPLWEIIVVDDNSPDECGQYVNDKVAPFLNRRFSWSSIRVLNTGETVGLAEARNIGIAAALGTWICALDADDMIGPDYFRDAEKAMTLDPNLNVIYSSQQFFEKSKWKWNVPEFQTQLALTFGPLPVMSLYPKKLWAALDGYTSVLPYGNEDYDFWMKLMEFGVRGCKLKRTHTFYRYKEHSMMRDSSNYTAVELAMLRTRHLSLHALDTILAAHKIISHMALSTFQRISDSHIRGPDAAFQFLWRGLYEMRQGNNLRAVSLFNMTTSLQNPAIRWQSVYYYAILQCYTEVSEAQRVFENLLSEYPELIEHHEVQQNVQNCRDYNTVRHE